MKACFKVAAHKRTAVLLWALFVCTFFLSAQEQVAYRITGVAPQGVKRVLLNTMNSQSVGDATVSNGSFAFEGELPMHTFLTLVDEEGMYPMNLIVDGEPIETNLEKGSLNGSKLNERFRKVDEEIMELEIAYMQQRLEYWQAQQDKSADSEQLRLQRDRSYSKLLVEMKNAIRGNADNVIPAFYLSQIYNILELDELKTYLQSEKPYASHPLLRSAWNLLNHREKTNVGQLYTDVQEPDTAGVMRSLSEFVGKGNYVLVDFWASWCMPCLAEMPVLKECYERYHSRGFEIVGLSFDRSREAWLAAIKRMKLGWVHLSDLRYWDSEASKIYGISSIPANLLLDGEGRIVATDLRGNELVKKLYELYAE